METEKQFFIVLSQPRAGTHLIAEYLNSHPQVHCDGEIFHPNIDWPYLRGIPDETPSEEVLMQFIEEHSKSGKVYGFQSHDFGFPKRVRFGWNPADLLDFEHKPKVIWIRRRNLLSQLASWCVALERKEWVKREIAKPPVDTVLSPDPRFAVNWIKKLIIQRTQLKSTLSEFSSYSATYEDICKSPQQVSNEIFSFLKLPPVTVKTNTIPQRTYRVPTVFANYEEIIQKLTDEIGLKAINDWMSDDLN